MNLQTRGGEVVVVYDPRSWRGWLDFGVGVSRGDGNGQFGDLTADGRSVSAGPGDAGRHERRSQRAAAEAERAEPGIERRQAGRVAGKVERLDRRQLGVDRRFRRWVGEAVGAHVQVLQRSGERVQFVQPQRGQRVARQVQPLQAGQAVEDILGERREAIVPQVEVGEAVVQAIENVGGQRAEEVRVQVEVLQR